MKHIFYLFLLALLVSSCAKDDVIIDERVPAYFPVQSKTVGRVLNQNGTPISDASVELNGFTAATNNLGLFNFDEMELNGAGTNITVRKLGYFNAFRTFIPNIPTISSVTVYMIERPSSGSFQSNVGGTISVNGGGSVTFLPNSIVTASGAPYTGEVVVSAFWIDPTDVNALSVMPGDLRGFSLDGDRVQLATYGMMVVELESPTGESLNIGNGMTATLTFPVSSSLLGSAPAVIPLWSFNETTGYWEEEGTADIVGNNYVAEVSHFSWWNCDAPFPVIDYELCVLTPQEDPVPGAIASITITSGNLMGRPLTTQGWTNSDGKVFGKIPINETLGISILVGDADAQCEFTEVFSGTIGPFSESSSTTINVDPTLDAKTVNLIGNFINCDGDLITDGVVVTSINDAAIPINPDGTVNAAFISCADEIEIIAYDFKTLKQSSPSVYPTLNMINNILIDDFSVCDDLDEYITIQYEEFDETFPLPELWSLKGYDISATLVNSGIQLSWFTTNAGSLNYSNQNLLESLAGGVNVTITSSADYLEGSYEGNVTTVSNGQTTGTVDVTGEFRILIQ